MGKKVIISVVSDLITDQRVNRSATALHNSGWEVTLVGRVFRDDQKLVRPYKVHRFRLWFNTGPLFYLNYNICLFVYLLRHSFDIAFSNDLDTLPANFIAARLKGKELVYDSHEYFTGVPELAGRRLVRNIWKGMEQLFLPNVKHLFTVNESIAELYRNEYNVNFNVLRNVPMMQDIQWTDKNKFRIENSLPQDRFIYIIQGSGINIDRGTEEAVEAMQYVNGLLLIVGGGDVIHLLHEKVKLLKLEEKVIFRPRMPYAEMMQYTHASDAGLTLDKDTNINYRFSLPNKLFDYIQAGIPVLSSDLVEIKKIITGYKIGRIFTSHQPQELAKDMMAMQDANQLEEWRQNLPKAAADLTWEKEQTILLKLFSTIE